VPAAPEGAPAPDPVDFKVGDMIKDPAVMASVQAAGQAHFCTPTDVPESFFAPDPQPEAPPAPKSAKASA
jgi:hypothetical protein